MTLGGRYKNIKFHCVFVNYYILRYTHHRIKIYKDSKYIKVMNNKMIKI